MNAEERYFPRQTAIFNLKVVLLYNTNLEKVNLRFEPREGFISSSVISSRANYKSGANPARSNVSYLKNDIRWETRALESTEDRLIYRITIIRLLEIL